jgi:4-hydroxythreonine-4-phosphate dehydrogenase
MPEFIFMLTRDDKTLPDAQQVFAEVATVGVTHVGCKDIGLP